MSALVPDDILPADAEERAAFWAHIATRACQMRDETRKVLEERDILIASLRAELSRVREQLEEVRAEQMTALAKSLAVPRGVQ